MQTKKCAQCSEIFNCGSSLQSCWCMAYSPVPIIDKEMDCLCPNCLGSNFRKNENKSDIVQQDYYIENGLYVFTESYHLKRGYCCKNGCRHCPFGFKKMNNETII
jgi:hypothetical protein